MRTGLRTFVRLTFGNWLSGSYLGLAAFFLVFGFAINGSYVGGLLGGLLGLPTLLVLVTAINSLGAWARGDAVVVCVVVFSYTFQAFLLGLSARAVRARSQRSGGVRSDSRLTTRGAGSKTDRA
ncbi:SCO4225 family membrane protein [Streptomyces sp. NPDC059851]|uniref:SCO4225 family membrane protein n=1 Tax=Streptomyces sp. NPDC059851 TaxID=3346971 RepID=UPI00364DCE3B